MKKLLLVVALFVGIPSFASADTLGCVGGALVGGVLGSKIGGGKTVPLVMTVLGASAGCNVGSRVEDGTYGQPTTEEVVVVSPPAPYPPQYGYSGAVVCDRYTSDGHPRRPGKCSDPDSGGETTYEDLQRRAMQRSSGGYQYSPPAVYSQQRRAVRRAVYSQEEPQGDKWDRPEKKYVASSSPRKTTRLTVDNYLQPGAVNSQCQTGNWGVDSNCLNALSSKLAELQERCERGEKNSECRKNPGVIAGEYRTLATALRSHQDRMQAGGY